jgi:hypothetical protein
MQKIDFLYTLVNDTVCFVLLCAFNKNMNYKLQKNPINKLEAENFRQFENIVFHVWAVFQYVRTQFPPPFEKNMCSVNMLRDY